MEKDKKIEIVTGDSSNLKISPVHKHLNVGKPKSISNRPKNIIVPKEIHKSNDKDNKKDN